MQNMLNVGLGEELRPQLDLLTIALMPGRRIRLAHPKIFVISQELYTPGWVSGKDKIIPSSVR
jgi:hypothetical protein